MHGSDTRGQWPRTRARTPSTGVRSSSRGEVYFTHYLVRVCAKSSRVRATPPASLRAPRKRRSDRRRHRQPTSSEYHFTFVAARTRTHTAEHNRTFSCRNVGDRRTHACRETSRPPSTPTAGARLAAHSNTWVGNRRGESEPTRSDSEAAAEALQCAALLQKTPTLFLFCSVLFFYSPA